MENMSESRDARERSAIVLESLRALPLSTPRQKLVLQTLRKIRHTQKVVPIPAGGGGGARSSEYR